jgi:hypothetical protein
MAIKKKVTYSVSYVAGTDTLTTKLNSLLQDIVTLILSQNTGLQILDTITVGSARWTGAPLYDTRPSNLYSSDYNGRHYESDVVFIGTNEDNVCVSLGFFDGNFVVAMNMTPKVEGEYVTNWSALGGGSNLPFFAVGKQSRFFKSDSNNPGNYSIPYRIINNAISISILYWSTEYSRGYSFINGSGESDGTDLVIFPTDEGNGQTGLGAAIWTWGKINSYYGKNRSCITAFSFAENLSNNKPAALNATQSDDQVAAANATAQVQCNSYVDIRQWNCVANNSKFNRYHNYFNIWHSLGSVGAQGGNNLNYISAARGIYAVNVYYDAGGVNTGVTPSVAYQQKTSVLATPYNLPHLNVGQAYVRKMRIPGWNPSCKGEIYLLWSPVTSAYQSGDIVEVGSKSYAIITEGAVCWAARVS